MSNKIYEFLTYITEELKDIPANADNIHYTNLPALISILKEGKIRSQHYVISLHNGTNEVATARPTKTNVSKTDLSSTTDNVKISLYTKRILAGARGVRKSPIAEYPKGRIEELKKQEKSLHNFIEKIPNFPIEDFKDWDYYAVIKNNREQSGDLKIKFWLEKNLPYEEDYDIVREKLGRYFRTKYLLNRDALNREGEERFQTKNGIPVDSKFMKIEFTGIPSEYNIHRFDFKKVGPEKAIDNCDEAIDILSNSDPNLVIRNSYFDKNIELLMNYKQQAKKNLNKRWWQR